jgi:hypothetical protein
MLNIIKRNETPVEKIIFVIFSTLITSSSTNSKQAEYWWSEKQEYQMLTNINDEQIIKSEILSFLFIYQVNLRIKPFLPLD